MFDKFGIDDLGRLRKQTAFMEICFVLSKLSMDNSSKCGCLAVHDDGALLSGGYNNPIRGSDDKSVPIDVRPDKYYFMEHSERNAVYNASRHGIRLHGCTFYVTGFPCVDCLRAMLQSGAKKIIYGPNQTRMSLPIDTYAQLLKSQLVVIERFKHDDELYNQQPRIGESIKKKLDDGIADISFEWNTPGLLWEKIEDSPA
jgi:dCMP deaminase